MIIYSQAFSLKELWRPVEMQLDISWAIGSLYVSKVKVCDVCVASRWLCLAMNVHSSCDDYLCCSLARTSAMLQVHKWHFAHCLEVA